jgi:hypothetical protein
VPILTSSVEFIVAFQNPNRSLELIPPRPVSRPAPEPKAKSELKPRPVANKGGRPRIGEPRKEREKPWEKAGMSERTWYRRQAEKRSLLFVK